ncbi:MAG: hypothetical protein J5957_04145 [Prevotella sp.]|nr:hypothetical protein [Prevotella sp.]
MKKKIFSSLLLVAFAFAATSMFVSCKDYDDDINELRSLIDKNDSALRQALDQAKTDLTNEINALKTQLSTTEANLRKLISDEETRAKNAEGALDTKIGNLDTKIDNEIARAIAKEGELEVRIQACDDAIKDINKLLGDGDMGYETFTAAVIDLRSRMEAVETDLGKVLTELIPALDDKIDQEILDRKAADADLQLQLDVLNDFKKKMEEETIPGLQAKDAELEKAIGDINDQLELIRKAIADNAKAIGENALAIEELQKQMQAANDAIEDLQEGLSQLNVLIKTSLRSLVFKPASYYEGIEACKLSTLSYLKYDLPAAAWNIKEKKGYDDTERYPTTDAFKVLSFVASYYMNPSSADLSNAEVKVIDEDKEYIVDRASEAGLTVKDWKVENGMLNVNLRVKDNSKIKSVKNDQMVTVFATQANITKGGKDTTITSDWAAVVAENISEIKIAHTEKGYKFADNIYSFTGIANGNDVCDVATPGHLFGTVYEAKSNEAQDTCDWNKTLDLMELVETHYTTVDGLHKKMDAATLKANGLEYKFELTSLILGENKTDESAHANIQGSIFRPQPADKDGKQQAYGADQVRASEIGRTPMVRVSLIDKETGDVLEYGYIRIRISETAEDTPQKPDEYITYTGKGYSYNQECEAEGWSYKTTWNQTEYDLYHKVNATREEWEANYGEPVAGEDGAYKQYEMKSPGIFVESEKPVGTINAYHETNASESGTLTHTLEWILTSAEAQEVFMADPYTPVSRAIKYESANKTQWPDVYVVFTTGSDVTITTPKGTVKLDETSLINNYWYTHNQGDEGFDEIRTNTLTPEDNAGGTADVLDATFSDVFTGNLANFNSLITVTGDNTKNKEFAADKLTLTFGFDKKNEGAKYNGVDGKTYTMTVAEDGLTLYAYLKNKNDKQEVAKITGDDAKTAKIEYQKTDYAKALLNYVAHNQLNDQTITAIIGIQAKNQCPKDLELENNTFDVRFLRPLNVYSGDKVIEDASIEGLQEIVLADLVTFDDWRDAWNGKTQRGTGGAYYDYYGIEGITIDGVEEGQVISTNSEITANLGQASADKFVSLQSVSNQLDFTLQNGKLVYKNLSNNLTEFTLKVPVMVTYIWGKVPAIAQVKVIRTHANAKKN